MMGMGTCCRCKRKIVTRITATIASAVHVPRPTNVHDGVTIAPPPLCNVTKLQGKYEETTRQYEIQSTAGKYENCCPVSCYGPPTQSTTNNNILVNE